MSLRPRARSVAGLLFAVMSLTTACGSLHVDQQGVVTASAPVAVPAPAASLTVEIPQAVPEWIRIDSGAYVILPQTEMYPGTLTGEGSNFDPVDDRPVLLEETNQPATDSPGTTGIIGHNYDRGGGFPPFAALQNVQQGDVVSLGMPRGVLQYTVAQIRQIPKLDMANLPTDLQMPVAGRLVLITCRTDDGKATTDNIVVVAQLTGSTPS